MKIISFAWTTDALLAGRKTCTRRDWTEKYARRFHDGDLVQAWDKLPRARGKRIAIVQLTADPELSHQYPWEDYESEGLGWMEEQGLAINGVSPRRFWDNWRAQHRVLWLIRFELVERKENT